MKWYQDEVEVNLPQELDFLKEKENCERCKFIFSKDKQIKVPWVYEALSNKRVMTMEYIEGVSVGDVQVIYRLGMDKKEIS